MQITSVHIKNFKSIQDMEIQNVENALILVGKNNTGKTGVLDAIRAAAGAYEVTEEDFNEKKQNIEITMTLAITPEDLASFHRGGVVSQYKRFDAWLHDFETKLPSYRDGSLTFTYQINWNGVVRFKDGYRKNNRYIRDIFPRLYYIDSERDLNQFQNDLLLFQEDDQLSKLRTHVCMFDSARECNQCFKCIGLINQKKPEELQIYETAKLLLEKYYSEIYDKEGNLSRISIITTNSCTNIKTYANLKYMNQVYLRDQFLMIRDGDGKNPEELAGQLCRYYDDRSLEEVDKLPKVTRRNVLILKYYSFENYFLNPKIMAKLGVVENEDAFYRALFDKWKEYLYRLKSGKQFVEIVGKDMESPEDLKAHMEEFKMYMRGHNLYDIFLRAI
uniref:AAA family ATPase n=1 Tax=Clostridium sp. NkU-1 TaxID=1095009 RepID=UPI000A4FD855